MLHQITFSGHFHFWLLNLQVESFLQISLTSQYLLFFTVTRPSNQSLDISIAPKHPQEYCDVISETAFAMISWRAWVGWNPKSCLNDCHRIFAQLATSAELATSSTRFVSESSLCLHSGRAYSHPSPHSTSNINVEGNTGRRIGKNC